MIAIFDCDHVPTRAFLQLTVGWLLRDARARHGADAALLLFARPVRAEPRPRRRVPNEGLLFYGLIQPGNDFWNATFFCGSCAVIRRTALRGGRRRADIDGDRGLPLLAAHAEARLAHRLSALPLAAGLATERLSLHIGQRLRWARGMIQILRAGESAVPARPELAAAALLLHGA